MTCRFKNTFLIVLWWIVPMPLSPYGDSKGHDFIIPNNYDVTEHLALSFLMEFEGFRDKAYWDNGRYSIGYGTKSYRGEIISKENAYLRMKEYYLHLVAIVADKWFDGEIDSRSYAVALLAYNVGLGSIEKSISTKQALESGRKPPFELWIKANGQIINGLIKRRAIESWLYDFNN